MPHVPQRHESDKLVEIFAAGVPAGTNATPYSSFADSLSPDALQPVDPVQALRRDPEIGGYLKHGVTGWTRKRVLRTLVGCSVSLALLVAALSLREWNLLRTYVPPPVSDSPKPILFTADPPLQYQEEVRQINMDIRSGDRWGLVFDRLRTLASALDASPFELPDDFRSWVNSELLVLVASKELPPDAYDDQVADNAFAALTAAAGGEGAVPLRAGFAYVAILHRREVEQDQLLENEERLLSVLEQVRSHHGADMDRNQEVLAIEAEHHIAALPAEYRENDRYLNFHWRRAAHAVRQLYAIARPGDTVHLALDRRRWEKVYSYFDFTLITLSYSKLGRIAKVTLDGRDYTREDVRGILDSIGR